MILNLVVNALDSMDEGGRLAIALQAAGGDGGDDVRRHRLRHDAGGAAEHLRAVLHPEPDRQGDGAGAVHQPPDHDQHGGEIEATSPGRGTAARSRCAAAAAPRAQAPGGRRGPGALRRSAQCSRKPAAASQTEDGDWPRRHNRLRVLFVDDEASLREFMRPELPRLGHEVTVCPDSRTALEGLEKATFDAAILDLRMPRHGRRRRCSRRSSRSRPDTEAVIMTGYASTETAVEALRLGAFDYIDQAVQADRHRGHPAPHPGEAEAQAQERGPAKAGCRRPRGRPG